MPFHEQEMYPIIQRIAYGLPGETDREAFIDGCRRSATFYKTAQWVARWYYTRSQDVRWDPKVRKWDLVRAMKLKAAMEEARRESLKDLFRVEKGWEQAIGEWGIRLFLNLVPRRFARAWPVQFDPEDE
jgi:hypothetical protein